MSNIPQNYVMPELTSELEQVAYAIANQVQSPLPIIKTSILSALSSVLQGYIKVNTPYETNQPVALYTLVVAESGERKTTTDNLIMKPLLKLEKSMIEGAEESKVEYDVAMLTWNTKKNSIMRQLRKVAESSDEEQLDLLQSELVALQKAKPQGIKTTRSILNDVTPAALFRHLEGENKCITLHSSDAGSLLQRTNMDFISNTNLLWDGDDVVISRVSRGESAITSANLTLSLMVQPQVMTDIVKRKKDVLRLSGWLARMLITNPYSMQGYRNGSLPTKENLSKIENFHQKLEFLLTTSIGHQAHKEIVTLVFAPKAQAILADFYEYVERNLGRFGLFEDVKDAGSKIVNNAIRIASLLHVYENGTVSIEITAEVTGVACRLAGFYLAEFKRLFGEKTMQEQSLYYAELLENWYLKNYALGPNQTVTHLMRYGPNAVRKREKLELALGCLVSQGKLNYYHQARPAWVQWLI